MPRNFANSYTEGIEEIDGETVYWAGVEMAPRLNESTDVTEEEYRIIEEYEDARERQAKAQAAAELRWKKPEPPPPPREPEPEEIPPAGKLTARQEEFCRHYAMQPVAMRAAVLAGYAESNAAPYGSRLLKNPIVLDRIAQLRAERNLHYVVERDTVHDKIEAVFFEALGERNHAAAISALKLQASLAGLLLRPAPERGAAAAKANKSQGRRAKKPTKAKLGAAKKPRKANRSQRKPR